MVEDIRVRFAELVAGPDAAIALDEAALLVGAAARPGLDVAAGLAQLDELAAGVDQPSVDGVVEHLFDRVGLQGDGDTYYDPANSVLPEVIERRRGIPISLAVVMIEVGRRCGVPLQGVGMPGHFLVQATDDAVLLDPFAGGRRIDAGAAQATFTRLHRQAAFRPEFLDPVGPQAILTRMLANLAVAFRHRADRAGLARVLELRLELPGAAAKDRRELAVLFGAAGRFAEGADVLEAVGTDSDRRAATRLRARLN